MIIELAVLSDETTDAALRTCLLRGWVEVLENAVPHGDLTEDGRLPVGQTFNRR